MKYSKINIFFDTNKLECRFTGNKLFLDDIKLNNELKEMLDFASGNDNVSFYIPLIVWREILTHLIDDFNNNKRSLDDVISSYRKGFGSLINISTQFSIKNYEEYINKKAEDFLFKHEESIAVVSHSNHEEKFKSIINNAINKKSPFVTAKGKNKTYSDAGFKDMLILETIIDNCNHDAIGVLYTDDRDFKEAFADYESDKYYTVHTISELKKFITDKSGQFIEKNIKKEFLKSEYIQENIYNEFKICKNDIVDFSVLEVNENEEVYSVNIQIMTNLKNYMIKVDYDYAANEITGLEEMECDDNE